MRTSWQRKMEDEMMCGAFKITFIAATIFASCAHAQKAEPLLRTKQQCTTVSQLAGSIMELRQMGEPMQNLIMNDDGEYSSKETNRLVLLAYEEPRFSTVKGVKTSIQDFSNEAFRHCYAQGRSG